MTRKILHIDLDAFFCSVEEILDPALKNIPFATGGTSDGRGVVTSCSYAARIKGIHSAMPMKQALRILPNLKTVRGHHHLYGEYSKRVMDIFCDITPLVEPISIDEAFLDVSDLPQDSREIAVEIQMRVKQETNLPCSIGGASNKLVAKIATNIGKSGHKAPTAPMAINIIPNGSEKSFLFPLPIREMWGIGPKSAEQLKMNGIHTIGDLQEKPLGELEALIGNFAQTLRRRAEGNDERPVGTYDGVKSVSNERTFFDNINNKTLLLSVAKDLSTKVASRLRKRGLTGKTVRVKMRWSNYETITRQLTLQQPINHDSVIFSAVKELIEENWAAGKKIRLIGVGVSKLEEDIQQLSLFDHQFQKERQLLHAVDSLHERFGSDIIKKGKVKKK